MMAWGLSCTSWKRKYHILPVRVRSKGVLWYKIDLAMWFLWSGNP